MKNARHLTQLAAATRKLRVRLCLTIISAFMCTHKTVCIFHQTCTFFKVISLYDIYTRQLWPTLAYVLFFRRQRRANALLILAILIRT